VRLSLIAETLGTPLPGEEREIRAMNTLADASADELSYLSDNRYLNSLETTKAAAVLVKANAVDAVPEHCIALVCEDVSLSMAKATSLFTPPLIDHDAAEPLIGEKSFIDPRANIEKGAVIGNGVTVMAGAYVGSGAVIGDDTVIFPNVTIYRDCRIGARCRIHGGTTIGADGFGYAHTAQGEHVKIYQNGNVVIEDDVEIGANCSIDRALFNSTVIRRGAKIDNNVHVGHNCDIGEHCIFVAQVGVGGSTRLGRNCVVSGQTAFSDHLEIAPFTTFTARSGVTKSIKESGKIFSGYPLMEHRLWSRLQSRLSKLAKEGTSTKKRAKTHEVE
jgi:UDP-3-O-[3-hydroxymyristoyl] glucosamine N-acyltransferase